MLPDTLKEPVPSDGEVVGVTGVEVVGAGVLGRDDVDWRLEREAYQPPIPAPAMMMTASTRKVDLRTARAYRWHGGPECRRLVSVDDPMAGEVMATGRRCSGDGRVACRHYVHAEAVRTWCRRSAVQRIDEEGRTTGNRPRAGMRQALLGRKGPSMRATCSPPGHRSDDRDATPERAVRNDRVHEVRLAHSGCCCRSERVREAGIRTHPPGRDAGVEDGGPASSCLHRRWVPGMHGPPVGRPATDHLSGCVRNDRCGQDGRRQNPDNTV